MVNQTPTVFEYSNFGAENTHSIKSLFENDTIDDGGTIIIHDVVVEEDKDNRDEEDSIEDRLDYIIDMNIMDINETIDKNDDNNLFINRLQVDKIGYLIKYFLD